MQVKHYQADNFIKNIAANKDIFAALIYGPESGLAKIRAKKIVSSIVSNPSDPFLIVNFNESQIEEDKTIIASEFYSIPMLGGRKVIVINGDKKVTESLEIIFESSKKEKNSRPLGDNFIVILAGNLDKNSSLRKFAEKNPFIAAIPCYEDDESTISNFIKEKLKEQNFTIDYEAIKILLDKFGKNRQIILNEIEKLILFMGSKHHININSVQESVNDMTETSIFDFVRYFADIDFKKSIYSLEKIFAERVAPTAIIRILYNHFIKLKLVKDNINLGSKLDLEMKIHNIFFKEQEAFKRHIAKWSQNKIDDILIKLQELETKCKSSSTDSEIIFASFVNFALISSSKNNR